jgi:hypothetical protein
MMSFLPAYLTEDANRFVRNSPAAMNPRFKRDVPGLVHVAGSILRYSSTTPTGAAKKGA